MGTDNIRKTILVLVQWTGILLEDTSWEKWESLKINYNLEDKVVLEAQRNVMNENTELETKAKEEKEHRRTKMVISKPWYLEDYATK